MGSPVTLGELKEAVRVACDLPAFDINSPVTDEEVTAHINQSIRKYYGILQEYEAEEWYTFETTLTTTPGQEYVALSSVSPNLFGVRAVHWLRGVDDVVQLERAQKDRWYRRSLQATSWDDRRPQYLLVRDRLYLMPPPSSVYSLRLWYVGVPDELEEDENSIDGGPGWEEFVIADVCAKIAESEEADPRAFLARREGAEQSIRLQCGREKSEPVFVRRVADRRDTRRIGLWRDPDDLGY